MAKFLGRPWSIIVCTEAAGNSASLSAMSVIKPIRGEFVVSGGTFEFSRDIWIFATQIMGDVANLTQVTIDSSAFAGGKTIFDSRENQPAETSTASADGFTDLRSCPIRIPAGDIPQVRWAEDASTNVEPSCLLYFSYGGPLGFQPFVVPHNMEPASCRDVTLAQTSTTAVTMTRGTNIMGPNNGDATPFGEEDTYVVTRMRSPGSATLKAGFLEIEGLPILPGISGAVDPNVSKIPPVDFFPISPIECTGKELNKAQVMTVDVAGSETPTYVFSTRRKRTG